MAKWAKVGIFIKPNFKMTCLGCGDIGVSFFERQYQIMHFPIYMDKPTDYNSYAIDRIYCCNLCGWRMIFGIAISKKHFEDIRDYFDTKGINKGGSGTKPITKASMATYSGRQFG